MDLLIRGGTLVTMDPQRRVIDDGAVVVRDGRIVDVGPAAAIEGRYDPRETIDATGMAVLPGLVDAHGHSGHALTKTMGEWLPRRGWIDLMDQVYFRSTTETYWRADGLLGALERLKFGTTCGVSIVGSRPRVDDAVYAAGTAAGFRDVGIRGIVGVGPPGPPWPDAVGLRDDGPSRITLDLDRAMRITEEVIQQWHGAADGRVRVYVSPNYLVPSVGVDGRASGPVVDDADRAQARVVRAVAERYGTKIHTHCHGDMVRRAHDGGLDILGPDVSLAHCTGIDRGDVRILAKTRTSVCHGPATRRFASDRCPVPELIDAGVTVALGTDGNAPESSFDLFPQMRIAMIVQRTHFADPRMMPAGKVLEMATIDAARALGLDDEIGSLESGKRGDVILVDLRKPHLVPPNMVPHRLAYEATGQDVDTVIVDGRILMRGRRVLSVDEAEIIRQAEAEAALMVERAGAQAALEMPPDAWGRTRY